MKKQIKDSMLDLLERKEHAPADLQEELGVSMQIIHRYLKELCAAGCINKNGKAPGVFYQFVRRPPSTIKSPLIDRHFLFKDPTGDVHQGADAFLLWSHDNLKKYSLREKVALYERYVQEMKDLQKKDVVFPLKGKAEEFHKQTGEDVYLQEIVCAVPYAFPDFGKTKESILLSIAKEGSSQSKEFSDQLVSDFLPVLSAYIKKEGFDAIAFVPPSASRRVQLMHILRKRFSSISDLPTVAVRKKHGKVLQQQKHLSKITERLKNADSTFYVHPAKQPYDTVLLVDDFVGSGATMNQIAKKMIQQGAAKRVYGIGIIGVRKGFKVVKKI